MSSRSLLFLSVPKRLYLHTAFLLFLITNIFFPLYSGWLKWIDPLIDFGQQIFLPSQLAAGAVLYRDIETLHGPLSPYFNAALLTLFGTSLRTLFFSNIALAVLQGALLFRLYERLRSRAAAWFGVSVFFLCFAWPRQLVQGNYNYVGPYSHELTHGLLLTTAIALLLLHYQTKATPWRLWLAGLLFGGAILTRIEIGIAAGALVGTWAILSVRKRGPDRQSIRSLTPFCLAALIAPLGFLILLTRTWNVSEALFSMTRMWNPAFLSNASDTALHQSIFGSDFPLLRLNRLCVVAVTWCALLWTPLMVLRSPGYLSQTRGQLLALLAFIAQLLLWIVLPYRLLSFIFLPLPLFLLLVGVRSVRSKSGRIDDLPWAACCFILLLKMLLNTRLGHYGQFLAMPGITFAAVILIEWAGILSPSPSNTRTARVVVAGVFSMLIIRIWLESAPIYKHATYQLGDGDDTFFTFSPELDWRSQAVKEILHSLKVLSPVPASLLVLPEGSMLNYLSRIPRGSRFTNLNPPEYNVFGEINIMNQLQGDPPELLLINFSALTSFGGLILGVSPRYFDTLLPFVHARYKVLGTAGARRTNDPFPATLTLYKHTSN